MNRVLKFRGRRKDNGQWVYGHYVDGYILRYIDSAESWPDNENTSDHKVIIRAYDVDENTVGQFTGLEDKNVKPIYEGDIIDDGYYSREVKWSDQRAQFYLSTGSRYKEFRECGQSQSDGPVRCDDIEIIGNIYEHPHLLK